MLWQYFLLQLNTNPKKKTLTFIYLRRLGFNSIYLNNKNFIYNNTIFVNKKKISQIHKVGI